MAVTFPRLSWWPWAGKDRETSVPSGSSTAAESSFLEMESLNFLGVNGTGFPYTSRKVKRKWHNRQERKGIDREFDVVLVPSDGGCMSGSESDDSDWSIGWLEPHASEFQDEHEPDDSFAVLVPCYGRPFGKSVPLERSESRLLGGFGSNFHIGYSEENKRYMEKCLSSLQEQPGFQVGR